MPSKKELLKRVEALEAQVRRLENMHSTVEKESPHWNDFAFGISDARYTYAGLQGEYCGRKLTSEELQNRPRHPKTEEHTASTRHISDVTHEELARYVLDGKPIERKMQTKAEYTTVCAPGVKTKSVKTDLGNISITEGKD